MAVSTLNETDLIETWFTRFNQLISQSNSVEAAANQIGVMTNLDTTAKGLVVDAINEVHADVNTVSASLTSNVSSLTSQINALSSSTTSSVNSINASISTINGTLTTLDTAIQQRLTDIVGDQTPQLGGDLDVNGRKIISDSDGDVVIEPDGTGKTIIHDTQFFGEVDGNGQSVANIFGKSAPSQSPSSGATVTLNRGTSDSTKITCPNSGTLTFAFSGFPSNKYSEYLLKLVNGGNVSITWPAGVEFANAIAPVFQTSGTNRILIGRDADGTYYLTNLAQEWGTI